MVGVGVVYSTVVLGWYRCWCGCGHKFGPLFLVGDITSSSIFVVSVGRYGRLLVVLVLYMFDIFC